MRWTRCRARVRELFLAAMLMLAAHEASAQDVIAWDAAKYFQYNVESARIVDANNLCIVSPGVGALPVGATPAFTSSDVCPVAKVIFSVTDPQNGNAPWNIKADGNIKADAPFAQTTAASTGSSLALDLGWSTKEYVNTASRFSLDTVAAPPLGTGAALPIRVNALTGAAKRCVSNAAGGDCEGIADITNRFWVSSPLPPQRFGAAGSGVVGVEGHPACTMTNVTPACPPPVTGATGAVSWARVPVKSVAVPFAITDLTAVARRAVVDFDTKCRACHDGNHAGIPRLGLHGAGRNEEPRLCVVCHNPNQTDIPYRTTASPQSSDPMVVNGRLSRAPEVSIDFKRMVHEIHAARFRHNRFTVVGFQGAVSDFGAVQFPGRLQNCATCHIDKNGKGTFELPLDPAVLGSTVQTGSVPSTPTASGYVDVDPANNLRITPIASVCSSCHDGGEVLSHMRSKGASFGVRQSDPAYGREQCVSCHGRGRDKDVRKVHNDD